LLYLKKNDRMENEGGKKAGPKDADYVNKAQKHEVRYEPRRKKPAKKFGSGSDSGDDPGLRK
jgi:hypothetical protein